MRSVTDYAIWQSCLLVPGLTRGECASWVQAIGSIVAIFAGLYGVARQLGHAEVMRKLDQRERNNALITTTLHVVEDAQRCLDFIAKKLRDGRDQGSSVKMGLERTAAVQEVLLALMAKELPPTVTPHVMRVLREVSYALAALRQLSLDPDITVRRLRRADRRARAVQNAVQAIASLLNCKPEPEHELPDEGDSP